MSQPLEPLITQMDEGEEVPIGHSRFLLRATSDRTGGAYTLIESSLGEIGDGPRLHRHTREDETFIVLSGEYAFFVDDDVLTATPGAVVFAPRGRPHRFEVRQPGSRLLHLFIPGGIDDYFRRSHEAIEAGHLTELGAEFGIEFFD
ncbi:MAG: cupin domain-containing protein [Mycobacteriales bacterium]